MDATKAILVVLLIAAIIVFSPLITIWAVNALFATNIAVSFSTWFAALWLTAFVIARKAS